MGKHKEKNRFDYDLIGGYVDRYNLIYLVVAILISLFEIIMIIRGIIMFDFSKANNIMYFCSYFYLLIASGLTSVMLIINRNHKVSHRFLTIVVHVFSFMIISWATLISCLDMKAGNTPIVYLTIIIVIAGIVVINPFIYFGYVFLSLITMVIFAFIQDYTIFKEEGYIFNFAVFVVMALIMAYRQYVVCKREETNFRKMKSLSYTDQLTGLGNETLYFKNVEKLEVKIKNGSARFAIAVMDVNCVKITNDTYGHRFGCNLIVTAGHMLPDIFTGCKIFHIGGDEFVVLFDGDSYDHIDDMVNKFKEELYCKDHSYEGVDLKLSLAIGYARYENGDNYHAVFQRADDAMYAYKVEMKEKLGLKSR